MKHASTICDEFFPAGGVAHVKTLLASAIRSKRDARGLQPSDLDDICCFNEFGLPKTEVFEQNPDTMRKKVYCMAALELDIQLDDVLGIDFCLPENMQKAMRIMTLNNGAFVAGLGEGTIIREEQIAAVYILSKILDEIDNPIA